jgi:hypothetical protein
MQGSEWHPPTDLTGLSAGPVCAAQVCSPVLDTLGLANATVRGRVVLCQAALDGCTLGPIDPTEVVQLTSCGAASAGVRRQTTGAAGQCHSIASSKVSSKM